MKKPTVQQHSSILGKTNNTANIQTNNFNTFISKTGKKMPKNTENDNKNSNNQLNVENHSNIYKNCKPRQLLAWKRN